MSYASFLKNVPEILSQPTGIAALASLGIHGAIAFILPLMPVESSKTATKQATTTTKPIGLSELSSNEQNRIPTGAPTNQPGIQSQLPPLPNQISALPSQQQVPLTLPGATTPTIPGLPPSPPAPNSSAFSPLPRASGFNIAGLPRGGSPVQKFNTKDLMVDPSRFSSTPRFSSRIPSGISSAPRNYSSDIAYGQPRQLSRGGLPDLSSGAPTNVPVYPPPLPTGDMATAPINNSLAAQPVQPGNEINPQNSVVRPEQYIAPVDKNPTSARDGNFSIAASSALPPFQPQSGGALDSVNNPSGAVQPGTAQPGFVPGTPQPAISAAAPIGSTPSTAGSNQEKIDQTVQIAKISEQFKKEYPQGQFRPPVNLSIDKSKLETPTNVSVIMDGEGKIADFKILNDGSKVSFEKQQAIRDRLQQYFKENPTSTNGKGALFSFTILPGNVTTTSVSDSKDALQNTQRTQSSPSQGNIFDRLSGVQSNPQSVIVPSVNTSPTATTVNNSTVNSTNSNNNTVKNSTAAPVLPPPLPGPLKPLSRTLPQGNQTFVPQLPTQKPTNEATDLPQTLRNVQPAPLVAPKKPVSNSQSATTTSTPEPSKKTLVTRLRNSQSSDNDSQLSVVEKLRKVKQQRENANQNANQ